jgi:hypothetical protein
VAKQQSNQAKGERKSAVPANSGRQSISSTEGGGAGSSPKGSPFITPLVTAVVTLAALLFGWVRFDIYELRSQLDSQKKEPAAFLALVSTLDKKEAQDFGALCKALNGDYRSDTYQCALNKIIDGKRLLLTYKPLTQSLKDNQGDWIMQIKW